MVFYQSHYLFTSCQDDPVNITNAFKLNDASMVFIAEYQFIAPLSVAEYKHILRIAGKDIEGGKKLIVALSQVRGLGYNLSQVIVQSLNINPNMRVGFLSEREIADIETAIRNPAQIGVPSFYLNRRKNMDTGLDTHLLTSDLDFTISNDIEREKTVYSWRGYRHMFGLKVRGQCTRTSGRKAGAVGVKKLPKPGPAGAPGAPAKETPPASGTSAPKAAPEKVEPSKQSWFRMGDPKKPKKSYRRPRRIWTSDQLSSELYVVGSYGLRNKKELWKAQTKVANFRNQARTLLALTTEDRHGKESNLLSFLNRLALVKDSATLDDVLNLKIEDILERRLQTIIMKKMAIKSPLQARQVVVHGFVSVGNRKVNLPGYLVKREEEPQILVHLEVPQIAKEQRKNVHILHSCHTVVKELEEKLHPKYPHYRSCHRSPCQNLELPKPSSGLSYNF